MSLKYKTFYEKPGNSGKFPEGYYKDKHGRLRQKRVFKGKSLTQQSSKDDCDINLIMKKHRFNPIKQPEYTDENFGDFSNIPNYQESLQIVIDADQAFKQLPSSVRKEMRDPRGMIQFCENEANRDRAIELGLIDKPEKVEPLLVKNVDDKGLSAKKSKESSTKGE